MFETSLFFYFEKLTTICPHFEQNVTLQMDWHWSTSLEVPSSFFSPKRFNVESEFGEDFLEKLFQMGGFNFRSFYGKKIGKINKKRDHRLLLSSHFYGNKKQQKMASVNSKHH